MNFSPEPTKNRSVWFIVVIILMGILGLIAYLFWNSPNQKLDRECKEFGEIFAKEHDLFIDKKISKIDFFYSKKLDTCVMSEVDELGNIFHLADIKLNFIRQEFTEFGLLPLYMGNIFYCDKDGADSAIIEKVIEYKGQIMKINYDKWLDNGEGGLPRTLKTPEKPYTREDCQRVYSKKIQEIR